jgi:hypothetical protein
VLILKGEFTGEQGVCLGNRFWCPACFGVADARQKYALPRDHTQRASRRIGRYRILYDVDTDLRLVTVYGICHRKEAYR